MSIEHCVLYVFCSFIIKRGAEHYKTLRKPTHNCPQRTFWLRALPCQPEVAVLLSTHGHCKGVPALASFDLLSVPAIERQSWLLVPEARSVPVGLGAGFVVRSPHPGVLLSQQFRGRQLFRAQLILAIAHLANGPGIPSNPS